MSIYSLFLAPTQGAFKSDVIYPEESDFVSRMIDDIAHNILYSKVDQYELDDTETRAITFANYTALSDWPFIVLRVVGEVKVSTVGVDTDNATAITGEIPCFGTDKFPGIFVLSTYNVTSFTVESLSDGSVVELFAGIAAEDDDIRLTENA